MQASTLAALLVAAGCGLALPARADCAADLRQLKSRLHEVGDKARREEAGKLIAKGEKDARSGRTARCADAAARAAMLIKPSLSSRGRKPAAQPDVDGVTESD